jgi:imidazolonepropionase-like amidohydrolase
MRSLEIIKKAGLTMAFGTDLLGEMHKYQSEEFVIRARVLPAIDIIRSATTIGAQLLRMEGKLGCLKPGAFADLLLVDGDPLKDLSLLTRQGRHLPVIMKGGRFIKNRLRG